MSPRILTAELRHIDDIVKIEKECFSLPWTRENLLAYLPDDRHLLLVAEDENERAIAYVGLMYVLDEGYISNVAVSPGHRRKGLANSLIEELAARAKGLELAFLTLEVRESNVPAIALYEKNGFVRVGLRKNYYDLPRENAILMTKFLSEE